MTAIKQFMGVREWAMLLALGVLWGGSFFFNAVALAGFPPLTAVTLRVALAAGAISGIALALGHPIPRDGAAWRRFLAMGLLNNAVPFSLVMWGQRYIPSGLASILNATTPLFAVLAASAFLPDEPVSARKLAGVLVGLAGVVLIMGFDAGAAPGNLAAEFAVLLAAVCYALAGAYGRRFADLPPMVAAAGQVTASAAMMVPLALLIDQPWSLPPPGLAAWGAVIALAILSTALAYWLYFSILRAAGATNLLLVTFLVPASAILLGTLFLGERLASTDLAGLATIAAGLSLIDGRLWRRLLARL